MYFSLLYEIVLRCSGLSERLFLPQYWVLWVLDDGWAHMDRGCLRGIEQAIFEEQVRGEGVEHHI